VKLSEAAEGLPDFHTSDLGIHILDGLGMENVDICWPIGNFVVI
jgi:hypothetical protein